MYWRPQLLVKYFIVLPVGVSHPLSSLSLFIHSLFSSDRSPREGPGERGPAFVLFICFLDPGRAARRSVLRGAALTREGGSRGGPRAGGAAWGRRLVAGRNVEGRSLPAEHGGRARPRLAAAGWARGYGCGGQSRMLAGSVRLQPFSSLVQRQLAPAGEGDLAALCSRTLVSQPRSSSGESQVPQVKPVSQNGPGTPAASLHLLGTATAERFPAPATQGARGEWSPLRGKERRGHRWWTHRPGARAVAVSSFWLLLGLLGARACRAAKKFGNFSSGAWWEPSRGCRIRRGQVRRGARTQGAAPRRGPGASWAPTPRSPASGGGGSWEDDLSGAPAGQGEPWGGLWGRKLCVNIPSAPQLWGLPDSACG